MYFIGGKVISDYIVFDSVYEIYFCDKFLSVGFVLCWVFRFFGYVEEVIWVLKEFVDSVDDLFFCV